MDVGTAALLGSVLGGVVASLVGIVVTQRAQRERDRDSDLRRIRDAKFARLRKAYVELLQAARTAADTAHRMKFTIEGETEEERDRILSERLAAATKDTDRAIIVTEIEDEQSQDVLKTFVAAWNAFTAHQVDLRMIKVVPGSMPPGTLQKDTEELSGALDDLFAKVRRHLAELQKSV